MAAAWKGANKKYSLKQFMESREVLIVGHSHIAEEAMNAISATTTDRIIKYTLNLDNVSDKPDARRIYFLLDELSNMAPIPGYETLIRVGRSKGAISLSSIQDVASFASKYENKTARSIIEMHSFLSIMECDHESAKLISDILGAQEIDREVVSESTGSSSNDLPGSPNSNQNSTTKTIQRSKRVKLEPYELTTEMPLTCPELGMTAYFLGYVNNRKKCWRVTLPFITIENYLPKRDPDVERWCNEVHKYNMPSIVPFRYDDYLRIGVTPPEEVAVESQEQEQEKSVSSLRAQLEVERQKLEGQKVQKAGEIPTVDRL